MIKLELLVLEDKVEEVKKLLREIGIKRMVVYGVKEYDEEHQHVEGYRGSQYVVDFVEKFKMELLLEGEDKIKRTLDMLEVANIDADILLYKIGESYRVEKKKSSSFSFR